MRIYKIFTDYAKEEKWLNEMAHEGYEVVSAGCGYKFKNITPEDAVYKIDFRTFKSKNDFLDYCTMFEDCGWEHISGTKSSGKQYFKKISDDGDDDIFSDNMSRAARYKRASEVWGSLACCYLALLVCFSINGVVNINALFNPKELYFTPGLWEMTGLSFVRAFLFETPFAIGRGFIWLAFPIGMMIYFYFSVKSKKLYKETKKNEI